MEMLATAPATALVYFVCFRLFDHVLELVKAWWAV